MPLPPDFNTFWKQAAQQGFKPKLATVAKVLLFPADAYALGNLVNNVATDAWWGAVMPCKSSLDRADLPGSSPTRTPAATGKQWVQTIGPTTRCSRSPTRRSPRSSDPHDKAAVAAALHKVNIHGAWPGR